jgi:hypothetical protein
MQQNSITTAVLQTARRPKTEVQKGVRQIKGSIAEKRKEIWRGKKSHGQFPRNLDEKLVELNRHIAG